MTNADEKKKKTNFDIDKLTNINGFEFLTANLPTQQFAIDQLIYKNCANFIIGKPQSSKSYLALKMAIDICCGKATFNLFDTEKGSVLYIDEENPLQQIQPRLKGLAFSVKDKKDLENLHFYNYTDLKLHNKNIKALREIIEKHKPKVVVLDSAIRFLVGKENESSDVAVFTNHLKSLMAKYNCTFIVLHHTTKSAEAHLDAMRGSGEFGAFPRSILHISKSGHGQGAKFSLIQVKNSYAEECEALTYKFVTKHSGQEIDLKIVAKKTAPYIFETIADDIKAWIVDTKQKSFKRSDVEEALKDKNYSTPSIKNALNHLKEEKVISGNKVYTVDVFSDE